MKTLIVSDLHNMHRQLIYPPDLECIIIVGDVTNYHNLIENEKEFFGFKNWLFDLDIKYKILVAGNHDGWATKKYNIDDLKLNNIIYLEHESVVINNIKIFGSPYTPNFGNWYFMKDQAKLHRYWEQIPEDTYLLLTHGPPKSILDLNTNRDRTLEFCGDSSLYKITKNLGFKSLRYHAFGHIHNNKACHNQGIRIIDQVTYMNVSAVTDGKFDNGLSSHGIIVDL
jgi:Icc-related predicted phosphoesterase